MKRALPLTVGGVIVALLALGAGNGFSLELGPQPTSPVASSSGAQALVDAGLAATDHGAVLVDAAAVLELLEQIPTGAAAAEPYDRDEFGQRWADADRNGCDTRNDILRRDLVDQQLKPGTNGCVVLAGTLHDFYTGQAISFVRGQGTSELVQIDHLWPLSLSWDHGAATWSLEQRESFANDPLNLQAVDGSQNASKSDSGPSEWLPADPDAWCEYVARFALVADVYQLTIDADDRQRSQSVLAGCGNQAG
jgi:hypothetical protein